MASQDIIARSATTTVPPSVRQLEEVAKLIDTTKCIGCKACQVACSEWNELRDEVGHNHGTYDNPQDLTAETWTLMRFTEHERDDGNLEWLIRKDGCMHCADPGCLKACPEPGRDHQARQRHRRLQPGPLHRLRLLHHRLPVQHPAHLAEGPQGVQVHPVFRPRDRGPGAGLRENLPDRGDRVRQQG
jgi:formate dehydrogenase beta subunit (EC 1.2.1.2)